MNITLSPIQFFAKTEPDERRRAAFTLALALAGGAVTRALFWQTSVGLNFWLWDLLFLASAFAVFRRGPIRPTAWGAATASALLGFSIVLYASEWTLFIAVPATLALLATLPLLLRDRYALQDLPLLPVRAVASVARTPHALAETARLPGVAAGGTGRVALRRVVDGLLVGIPTAGVFALLLGSDTDFAAALARVRDQLGDVTVFALSSLLSSGGYLFTYALHRVRPESSSGADASGHPDVPYRAAGEEGGPLGAAPLVAPAARLAVTTWGMVIGQVTLVFALFVGANLRHLFGGAALVRAPGSLTYATYLHAGFTELLVATVLSVCLVLVGHVLLPPKGGARGAAVPGGKVLAGLEGALLVLTGITLVSCWQRLRIYEDAYGASHLRLGVAFVELTVLGLLVLTLGKVAFRRWTGHGGAVVTLFTAIAVLASGFNTDAYVALRNLDRAADGKTLDVPYLASLSADARAALDHPFVKASPALAARLEASFCAPRADGFRAFRGIGRCGRATAPAGATASR
jgi:Domain of unknown function (DUF4173)